MSIIATAALDGNARGYAVPALFLGLSHEVYPYISDPNNPNAVLPAYRQLLRNLLSFDTGPLYIRFGGSSQDTNDNSLSPTTLAQIQDLIAHDDIVISGGINLASRNLALSQAQLSAYEAAVDSNHLLFIELGNEPDIYVDSNNNRISWAAYMDDYQAVAQHLVYRDPLPHMLSPSWAVANRGVGLPSQIVGNQNATIQTIGVHFYEGAGADSTWTPMQLLDPNVANAAYTNIAPILSVGRNYHLPVRYSECNSLTQGGRLGVSNTFASALWALDMLLLLASEGVAGVNFHGGNTGAYSAIWETTSGTGPQPAALAMPEYYGMLAFQKSVRGGQAQFLKLSLTTQANVRGWALDGNDGTTRVVLINKDPNASGLVHLTGLPPKGSAEVTYLIGPAIDATNGLTIGGQTLDGALDGKLRGEPLCWDGQSDVRGDFDVPVPSLQAAFLEILPAKTTL